MPVLLFVDRGWTVATAAWTAASKDPKKTEICYTWGSDGISFFDSATGTSRIELDMPFAEFLRRVQMAPSNNGIVNLTK